MQPVKKSSCINCGYSKPPVPKNPDADMHCGLCDETFKKADAKAHKKKQSHIIKMDVIKKIKELDANDEEDKNKIEKISKTLTPKYVKKSSAPVVK